MMNEWTDRLPYREALEVSTRAAERSRLSQVRKVEKELRQTIDLACAPPGGLYEALHSFLRLREQLFPGLPVDVPLKILTTIAETLPGSGRDSITGITHGAGVPATTVLRYVAIMETQGIIERVPHPSDGRQVLIRLTAEGRRRLDELAEKWKLRALLMWAVPAGLLLGACRVLAG